MSYKHDDEESLDVSKAQIFAGDTNNVNRGRNTGQGRVVLNTESDSSTDKCTHYSISVAHDPSRVYLLWNKTQKREKDLPLSFSRG